MKVRIIQVNLISQLIIEVNLVNSAQHQAVELKYIYLFQLGFDMALQICFVW